MNPATGSVQSQSDWEADLAVDAAELWENSLLVEVEWDENEKTWIEV